MNKKITFCLAFLVGFNVLAMQQQEQKQKQQHDQQKKDKKKQRWYSNDKEKESEQPVIDIAIDQTTDDLNAMLFTIMNQINQEHGSVTNMIENLKHEEHQRICPTCGMSAEECSVDRDRIAQGNIMTCGCPICGGLQE